MINKNKIRKIVEAIDIKYGDALIEIGPGHGELTEEIIERFGNLKIERFKLVLIEKDDDLAKKLANKFKFPIRLPGEQASNSQKELILKVRAGGTIIVGDALEILPSLAGNFKSDSYKLVGNIPYYITGYLFRILGELKNKPEKIILMVQKEVAERICAKIPNMNILAASVQIWAEPKVISKVPKEDFRPQPKVDSAVICLRAADYKLQPKQLGNYYKFIRILFKQPRKTILNNLTFGLNNIELGRARIINRLEAININPGDRPQSLNIKQIVKISESFKTNFI